ncbi:MAG: TlpA family protein disulfide reductase [Candidatus Nanopelagicales bacterium]
MRIAAVALTALLLTGCGATADSPSVLSAAAEAAARSEFTIIAPQQRALFPAWSGTDLDGNAWNTSTLGARYTVVNFWASWCQPCVDEWPELQAAFVEHPDVNFLGINTMDELPAARAFIAQHPSDYRQLPDGTAHILKDLTGIPNANLPTTIILDNTRRVAAWKSGPLTVGQLRRALARLRR